MRNWSRLHNSQNCVEATHARVDTEAQTQCLVSTVCGGRKLPKGVLARAAPNCDGSSRLGIERTALATSERGGAERHGLGHPALTALSKREVGGLKRFDVLQCIDRWLKDASISCLYLLHPRRVTPEDSLNCWSILTSTMSSYLLPATRLQLC